LWLQSSGSEVPSLARAIRLGTGVANGQYQMPEDLILPESSGEGLQLHTEKDRQLTMSELVASSGADGSTLEAKPKHWPHLELQREDPAFTDSRIN
jgi:hypothetical protein